MTVAFRCQCGQKLRAKKTLAGRQTRCPKCGKQVTIPTPEPENYPKVDTGSTPRPVQVTPVIEVAPASREPAVPAPDLAASSAQSSSVDLMISCGCGRTFRISTEFAGRQLPCPGCGTLCSIPSVVPAQASLTAEPTSETPAAMPLVDTTSSSGLGDQAAFDPGPIPQAPAYSAAATAARDEFAFQRIGLLIAAIALCVSAGSYAMWFLAEGMAEIGVSMVTAGISKPPKRPDFDSSMSMEQQRQVQQEYSERLRRWMEKNRDQAEKRQKRAKSANNLNDVSLVFLKIAHIVLGLSLVASIVGFVFCFLNPKRPGIMGVAIALTAVAALAVIFQMIFQTIPILDSKDALNIDYRGHYPLIFSWPREADAGDIVLSGFVDTLIHVPFVLTGVLLILIGRATTNRQAHLCGITGLCLAAGYLLFLVILLILGMIEVDIESMTPLYVIWILKWLANIALIAGFIFLIRGLFVARRPSGQNKVLPQRSFAANSAFR